MSLLDEYGIERDPRFERAAKEAKVIITFVILWLIYCIIILYWGSIVYEPQYSGVIGIPAYFFLILVGGLVVMMIGIWLGLYYIEDTSLDAWRK